MYYSFFDFPSPCHKHHSHPYPPPHLLFPPSLNNWIDIVTAEVFQSFPLPGKPFFLGLFPSPLLTSLLSVLLSHKVFLFAPASARPSRMALSKRRSYVLYKTYLEVNLEFIFRSILRLSFSSKVLKLFLWLSRLTNHINSSNLDGSCQSRFKSRKGIKFALIKAYDRAFSILLISLTPSNSLNRFFRFIALSAQS